MRDPLKNLLFHEIGDDSSETVFNGQQLDINYRAALEVTRSGELSININTSDLKHLSNLNDFDKSVSDNSSDDCNNFSFKNYNELLKECNDKIQQNEPNPFLQVPCC